MRVLVTGGLGYIGGRVCAALSRAGHEVVVGDRLASPPAAGGAGQRVVLLDVTDAERTREAVAGAGADAIVHLAAVNEIRSLEDPQLAYRVNCEGTFNVLSGAVQGGVGRFLYFSTYHVYGRSDGHISEDTPTAPSHPYATTHRAAEDIARYFARYHGIAAATFRLSNAFGAPHDAAVDRWSLAVNDFCRQATLSGELVLRTVGGQHRDFVTLHDVAAAVVHALASDAILGDGQVFNLGGRTSLSIRRLAEIVARIAERERAAPIPVRAPEGTPSGDPVDYDMSRLEATGFRLTGSMEDEIAATLAVCRAAVAAGRWSAPAKP